MNWERIFEEKLVSAKSAAALVKDGDRIFIGYAASVANGLVRALAERRDELHDVVLSGGLLGQDSSIYEPESDGHINSVSLFVGGVERKGISNGVVTFSSPHLSMINKWVEKVARPNIAFIEVSEPDDKGYMSYGACGVGFIEFVKEMTDTVILQVNRRAPYVYGESNLIHVSEADAIVRIDDDLLCVPESVDEISKKIADNVLGLIPDGACIQLGIGSAANAIGYALKTKNDLGVHTEMFTDSMMMLQKEGVINNKRKNLNPFQSVAAFALGSKELYEYIDHNEELSFRPFSYVNDPFVIGQNDNMISVNTAMAIDVYGQVAADSLGFRQQSAVGGQLDYVRGSQRSKGGKSIIVLPSTVDAGGKVSSRITITLPFGTSVTTPRSDVQYVATEYGCVDFSALPMSERVRALISLAHPDFRSELEDEAKEYGIIK